MIRFGWALLALAASVAAAPDNTSVQEAPAAGVSKRYVAALARNGDLPLSVRREWHKKLHPAVSAHRGLQAALSPAPNPLGIPGKRYVGALARSGLLPGKRAVDGTRQQMQQMLLLQELAAAEQLQDAEQQLQMLEDEKRSLASLARGGALPGKRFDDIFQDDDEIGDWKRGISTLAKNGQLPASLLPSGDGDDASASGGESDNDSEGEGGLGSEQKRGGVAALARLGHLPPHKRALDWLLGRLEEPQTKRNVGSLARAYALPPLVMGKRNLGALARGGGFSALRYAGSKKSDGFDVFGREDTKRSAASLARNGLLSPIGKRYLGALMRSRSFDAGAKRNIGALARNWYLPSQLHMGKRDDSEETLDEDEEEGVEEEEEEEPEAEEVTKRYVAALLRHGRLPVGLTYGLGTPNDPLDFSRAGHRDDDNLDEEKRHLGALRRVGRSPSSPASSRPKRQAYLSDEYPLPVFQTPDSDYVDNLMTSGNDPQKRFLGRIPQMGRPRPRPNSQLTQLRRSRPRSRNI